MPKKPRNRGSANTLDMLREDDRMSTGTSGSDKSHSSQADTIETEQQNMAMDSLSRLRSPLTRALDDALESSWVTEIEDAMDQLTDKRQSTRDSAWQTLVRTLSGKYDPSLTDALCKWSETLWDTCKRTLKRVGSTPVELSGACRVLALMAVQLDWSENEEAFADVSEVLKDVVRKGQVNETVRADAVHVLGFLTPLLMEGASMGMAAYSGMLFKHENVKVVLASLQAWSYLLSFGSQVLADGDQVGEASTTLSELLKHQDLEVRIASGEALALLSEQCAWSEDELLAHLPLITDIVGGLVNIGSTESARRVQKRDRASQKSAFRDILATLETFPDIQRDADFPAGFDLQFRGDTLHISSWSQLKRLHLLRLLFAEGLQTQVQMGNAIVRELLGLSPMAPLHLSADGLSKVERRSMLEEQELGKKVRGQAIGKSRSDKRSQRDLWHQD